MCEWNHNLIIQDIVLAIVINTSATLLGGDPFDHTWYIFTCVALATNVLGQFLLPTGSIAAALTKPLGDASWRIYAQIFIENLIFVTIISFIEAWVHTGGAGIVAAWLSTYVYLVLIGYVTSVILYHALKPRA
ncbi:ABC transporter ATPase [Paratractidigestivibacter sp.]|uniref:ABC transporter ATPase n=1 Tax=Paratractidigestivibacter sp. TaxID=2847316 RepID=UPI002ABDB6E0|nr:ABC transporter ATPase [Paratractidigestivibacter sp.]